MHVISILVFANKLLELVEINSNEELKILKLIINIRKILIEWSENKEI